MFNRDSIRSGHIPFWNPYNGGGVPHLANYQSALFSLYSIPFYILGFKQALIVSAFLKLFGIGVFTFLFLKELKVRQTAALIGATAFMFSGYNMVWLGCTNTSVVVTLPASMYFTERIFNQFRSINN